MQVLPVDRFKGGASNESGDKLALLVESQSTDLVLEIPVSEAGNVLQALALAMQHAENRYPDGPKPLFTPSHWALGDLGDDSFVEFGLLDGGKLRFHLTADMLIGMRDAINARFGLAVSNDDASGQNH